MAEIVASAVVGETLSRISTFIMDRPDKESSERDDLDRLEMAHIKMEAALYISNRWPITDVPMLRWRRKLKRAAHECHDTLRHCKQRALEDQQTTRSSFPRRIAHAAKSLMSSFSGSSSSSGSVDVRRFERFAEGTAEFLKVAELGGTPRRQCTFLNPIVGDLLEGKTLRYQALEGGRFHCLGVRPTSFPERGVEWRQNSATQLGGRRRSSLNSGSATLKLGLLFITHDSPEGIDQPAAESCAFEVIDGKKQEIVHRNACLQDFDEKLLPKAIDHLCQNSESGIYQMCLRSRHGTAHLCVEKTISHLMPSTGRSRTARSRSQVRNTRVDRKRKGSTIEGWLEVSKDLLKLWAVRASDKLHGSIRSWIVNAPRRD